MRRVKRGEAEQTIVDLTDNRKLIVLVSTSKARQIIYNPNNGTYSPDFSKEPMVLTPELYITGSSTNVIATAETVKWYVRPNTLGQRIPIENDDTYSIGADFKLTISKNIMKDMLTMEFIVEVVYREPDSDFKTTIPHHIELVNISMGEAGRGIISITDYYLVSSKDTGILVEDNEQWSTTIQQTTPTNRYLWNYEEIAYTDGTKDIIGPSIIGTHGTKGDSPIVAYLSNDSHSVPTDADGLNVNYTNAYTEMRVMDGIKDDTDNYTFSVEESIGITGDLVGNKYTVTSLSEDQAEVKITATKGDFTISKVFTVTKSKQGITGQNGEDSLIYRLETDSLVLTREVDETLNPRFINIQAVSMKGNDPKKPFTGYFRIYEQHTSTFVTDDFTKLALESGITEEEYIISLSDEPRVIRYESIFKESSLEYEPRADAISVYIQLFKDNSFNEVLDSQTVVIVSHGAKGEDAYRVEVLSRNGNTFKNGVVDTWLYAVVYKGEEDITDELDISRFRWERVSEDSASDTLWNQRYFGGTKEIRITTEDVYKRATFTCSITKQ